MDKLKTLRVQHRLTQEQLAEQLRTTQQTVARWETGKSEPNLAALRDLAIIFGTSVDDLLDLNAGGRKGEIASSSHHHLWGGDGGYWGRLGVRPIGAKLSTWYPISLGMLEHIQESIAQATPDKPWLVVRTLNNRALVMNLNKIRRLSLLDEAQDEPEGDWEPEWDSSEGCPQEVYVALGQYYNDVILGGQDSFSDPDASEAFNTLINELVEAKKLDQDSLEACLINTNVHFIDGSKETWEIEGEISWTLYAEAELQSEMVTMLDLSAAMGGFEIYVSRDQVALVDMPLQPMLDAAKEELEMLDEDQRAEAEAEAKVAVKKAAAKRAAPRKS